MTFQQPVPGIREDRKLTERLVEYIAKHAESRTFTDVAKEVGLDEKTVRSIFEEHAETVAKLAQPETPRVLGIDEVHIRHHARCVFTNIEAGTLIELLSGRSYKSVHHFLVTGLKSRSDVELVCIDMHRPYLMAVRDAMPEVIVVIDKYHVIKMANVAVDKVRLHLRSRMTDRKRRALMRSRFLLLKRKAELKPFERVSLEAWLDQLPLLRDAYERKESFYAIYDAIDRGTAIQLYTAWKRDMPKQLVPFFQPLLTAMENWTDEIFAYFDHRYTNATTEALNGLIKGVNRQGRGYLFRTLRAKMLFTKGVRKKVAVDDSPRYGWRDDLMGMIVSQPLNVLDLGADISTLSSLFSKSSI
jgi:transposase